MKRGMVRDAASAKLAASANVLLRSVELVLADHARRAEEGEYGGRAGQELAWDLTAARARLETVRLYINGWDPKKGADGKFEEKPS